MAAKISIAFCAQVLLIQCAFSQCAAGLGAPWGRGGPTQRNGLASPLGAPGVSPYGPTCGAVASTGGGFPITSTSPIAPTGISVFSENAIEGTLSVGGNLPFLATVAIEGVLPTSGTGVVSYGCGSGSIGIAREGPIATGIVGPALYVPAPAASAYGPGVLGAPAFNGRSGYACGAVY